MVIQVSIVYLLKNEILKFCAGEDFSLADTRRNDGSMQQPNE